MNIRSLREAKKMAQKELAITLGVSQPTVCDWENGRKLPSAKNMMRIAEIFGVTVEELISGTAKPAMQPAEPVKTVEDYKAEAYSLLDGLTQEDLQHVRSFIAGLKASRKE